MKMSNAAQSEKSKIFAFAKNQKYLHLPIAFFLRFCYNDQVPAMWGISTVGSARHSHCRGQEFESPMLHQKFLIRTSSSEKVRICFMIEISLAESIVTFFRCIKRHESICIRCFRALFMVAFQGMLTSWVYGFPSLKRQSDHKSSECQFDVRNSNILLL